MSDAAGPDRVRLCWSPLLARYDFGPAHPMQPVRVTLAVALGRAAGLLDHPALQRSDPSPAPDEDLLRVHSPELVAAVRRLAAPPERAGPTRCGIPSRSPLQQSHYSSSETNWSSAVASAG